MITNTVIGLIGFYGVAKIALSVLAIKGKLAFHWQIPIPMTNMEWNIQFDQKIQGDWLE